MAAELEDRYILVRPQSRSRQRVTREGVRFRTVLRHAEGRALHLFEPAYFRITADQQLLAREIGRRAKDRHIRSGHAPRVKAVTPAKTTSTSPAMSDWTGRGLPVISRISRQVVLGENSALLGEPRQRQ